MRMSSFASGFRFNPDESRPFAVGELSWSLDVGGQRGARVAASGAEHRAAVAGAGNEHTACSWDAAPTVE